MTSTQAIWNFLSRLGIGRAGFVTPYKYLGSAVWDVPEYAEVRALFEDCRPEFRSLLANIRAQDAHFARFAQSEPRPDWRSDYLSPFEGAAIYTFIAHYRPARVLEVGSGNSTQFMARADLDHGTQTSITCIDPASRFGIERHSVTLHRTVLAAQDIPLADQLLANDFHFIDGSHLLQQGFDLDILFNRMFPRLAPGVIVHVHDIYLPYPYPSAWERARRNEQTGLIGWLLGGAFRLVLSSYFALRDMAADLAGLCLSQPEIAALGGGSLWLRRS